MQHPKNLKEFGFGLPILLGLNVFARNITSRLYVLVMNLFLKLLGMLKVFFIHSHYDLQFEN